MTTRPRHTVAALADDLAEWLPRQRWYAAKGSRPERIDVRAAAQLSAAEPALLQAIIDVDGTEPYQLLIGLRSELPEHLSDAVIGRVGGAYAYEATQDPQLMALLLELMSAGRETEGIAWQPEPGVRLVTGLRARPIGVEQSNTSVIFGYHYILKLFRRPTPGPNRDVELHRALFAAGSQQVAQPVAVVTWDGLVLGFAQRYLADSVEGWAAATASVRDLLAEADLFAAEVGGDFAGEAGRLGEALATVHLDLARVLGTERMGRDAVAAAVGELHARLDRALAKVPELAEHEPMVRAAFDALGDLDGVDVQQVHGDLHLGQTLRTTTGWVLIDFEGEPAASPAERLRTRSPLRDVAGMLRSFDYAALHLLAGTEPERQQLTRALEWADRNRAAFCDGYAAVAGDPRDQAALLRALELDKAVYEVVYEAGHRPDWLGIPLAALRRAG
ncbi:maltokinase N-terminal cap-like domain-containing protein [Actinokineospora sp. NPDC004072]